MHGRKKPWGGAQLASFDNRSSFVVDDVVMQPVKGICDLLPVPRRLPVQDSRNENSCAYRGESALAAQVVPALMLAGYQMRKGVRKWTMTIEPRC